MTDLRKWLEHLGLGQYAEAFEGNAVERRTLRELDHELLEEIGAVGHRVAILKARESPGPEADDEASSVALHLALAAEAER